MLMLARTASALYWLGRYVERADFAARLVEATVRLDALSARPAGEAAWASALTVTFTDQTFAATGKPVSQAHVAPFLTIDPTHGGSIAYALASARDNAHAVRTALTRDAWTTINRAWLIAQRATDGGTAATLAMVEAIKGETRGFDGAIQRMMRNEAVWLIQLGGAIERADNTARLLDVKYHLLLPQGEAVGGVVDRDQWTTILQTVSAVTAYRWLYNDGLTAQNIVDLLIRRFEMPRSLAACVEEVVALLSQLGRRTGLQGEADRLARQRLQAMHRTEASAVILSGLHEYLADFIADNAELDGAIARQFRFV